MSTPAPSIPQELLHAFVSKSPWAFAIFAKENYELAHWNRTFARWFDPKTQQIPEGLKAQDFLTVETRDEFHHKVMPHARVFGTWEGRLSLRDMWGSEYQVYACIACFRTAEGCELYGLTASALHEAASATGAGGVADSDLLHALLETLPMSVYFKDTNGRFIRTSTFKAQKHGFTDAKALVGLTDFDLFTSDHAQPAYDAEKSIISTGRPLIDMEEMETYAGGHVTWASSSKFPLTDREGHIVGTYGISRDITGQKAIEEERREMEMQMALSQKLESIGRLASGVAHEINTPAQFISDNTQFLKKSFTSLLPVIAAYRELTAAVAAGCDTAELQLRIQSLEKKARVDYLLGEIPQTLDDSLDGLARVRNIVKSLKEFSHPSKTSRGLVNINKCIETTVAVSRHEWRYVAEVKLDLAPELPSIMGSFDELNQVILNMIVNAAHAIDDARTRRGDSALGLIHISTTLLSDQSIELRISDNGQGIPEEIRSRIFDPFFTTKEVGKGTGQGLAICRSVVTKNHGGSVSFETEVGKGTTFIIQLPIGNPVGDDHDTAPAPSGQGA